MTQNKSVEEVEDEIEYLWLEYSDLHTKENLPRLRELFKDFQKTLQQERQTSQEREREMREAISNQPAFELDENGDALLRKHDVLTVIKSFTNPNKD